MYYVQEYMYINPMLITHLLHVRQIPMMFGSTVIQCVIMYMHDYTHVQYMYNIHVLLYIICTYM